MSIPFRHIFRARLNSHFKPNNLKPTNLFHCRPQNLRSHQIRTQSSSSTSSSTPSNPKSARLDRILSRLPKFLHPWTNSLRSAPGSNIVAFLILHEITAIVPLVGLAGAFHWSGWLPTYWTEAQYIIDGTEKFGRYFARKGWFGFQSQSQNRSNPPTATALGEHISEEQEIRETEKRWGVKKESSRILVEVATAWAITKVFLPARILVSVWATPWFARVVVGRVGHFFGTMGRGNVVPTAGGAGAVTGIGGKGGGVIGKGVEKGHKP